ncbi:MAG TPA: DUF4157 domain-containing protein, partial [Burkholderiaceae bacterium]|nr:DUF4157 domain-containing protein [Burkholderiaceae bacterium]
MSSHPGQVHVVETDAQPRVPAAEGSSGLLQTRPTREGGWRDSPRQLQQHARLAQLQEAGPAPQAASEQGLPLALQQGVEALSGVDMSGVRVHRNSSKPATLQAHAFAQGQDIFLGPGQERHLPHEAWHVVQQAQGRVQATMQMKEGTPVNDDAGLEREADVMGARALGMGARQAAPAQRRSIESRPLVTAAGTLLGVAQCAGDKVAFKAGDVSTQTQEIQDLANGVA